MILEIIVFELFNELIERTNDAVDGVSLSVIIAIRLTNGMQLPPDMTVSICVNFNSDVGHDRFHFLSLSDENAAAHDNFSALEVEVTLIVILMQSKFAVPLLDNIQTITAFLAQVKANAPVSIDTCEASSMMI